MTVTKWERENSIKSSVEWKSGSTYVDPSSNMSFIEVYNPYGTRYIADSGIKDATGKYHYYISTQSDAELGLWKIRWYAYFNYGSPFNYLEKSEMEVVNLVDIIQT